MIVFCKITHEIKEITVPVILSPKPKEKKKYDKRKMETNIEKIYIPVWLISMKLLSKPSLKAIQILSHDRVNKKNKPDQRRN